MINDKAQIEFFEERAYNAHFISCIGAGLSLKQEPKMMTDFLRKDEKGQYLEEGLAPAEWGFKQGLKYGVTENRQQEAYACLEDVVSHHASFKDALLKAAKLDEMQSKRAANSSGCCDMAPEEDQTLYYQHENQALDRMLVQAKTTLRESK